VYHPPGQPETVEDASPLTIETTAVDYYVWQWERGEQTNKLHGQGFVMLNRRLRLSQVLAMFNHAVNVSQMGSRAIDAVNAANYCKKEGPTGRVEGTSLHEYGTFTGETSQGTRTDFDEVLKDIDEGKTPRDIMMTRPAVYAKYSRWVTAVHSEKLRKRSIEVSREGGIHVSLFFGAPGVGKSKRARDEVQQLYGDPEEHMYVVEADSTLWFDGYFGEEAVLFDDIGPSWFQQKIVSPEKLLRLLDRYSVRLNVKHSYTWRACKRVYLTSNLHP